METGGKKVIVPLVMKIAQHPKAKLFYLILLGTRSNTTLRDPPQLATYFFSQKFFRKGGFGVPLYSATFLDP